MLGLGMTEIQMDLQILQHLCARTLQTSAFIDAKRMVRLDCNEEINWDMLYASYIETILRKGTIMQSTTKICHNQTRHFISITIDIEH